MPPHEMGTPWRDHSGRWVIRCACGHLSVSAEPWLSEAYRDAATHVRPYLAHTLQAQESGP